MIIRYFKIISQFHQYDCNDFTLLLLNRMTNTSGILNSIMDDLLEIKPWILFALICLITFLILYIKKTFIFDQMVAFQILEERGEAGIFKTLSAIQFASIPLIYLFKFTFTGMLLWLGCAFFGYRVSFYSAWQVAVAAEFIFILPELIRIFWFIAVVRDPSFWQVRSFYPLSILQLFDYGEIPGRWHYPLKSLNVFEVIYWFLLVAGIHIKAGKRYKTALIIVLSSYVFFFFVWLAYFVIFY